MATHFSDNAAQKSLSFLAIEGCPVSAELLFSLLNAIPDPVFVKDENHRWVYVNQAFCTLVGHSVEEMLGKSDYDFLPKEQADVLWVADEEVFTSGRSRTNTEKIINVDGIVRTIVSHKSLCTVGDGCKLLVGTIRDASNIHHLHQQERQMSKILKEIALGQNYERVLAMLLEVAENLFPGMTASLLTVDETGKRLRPKGKSHLPDYFVQAIDGTPIREGMGACGTAAFRKERVIIEDLPNHPYWQRVKEHTSRAKLLSAWSEPVIDSGGEVIGTFALYYNDIRSPTKEETYLMESMAQLASIAMEQDRINKESTMLKELMGNIVDFMPSVLIGVDINGRVTLWNREAEKLSGASRGEAVGQLLESVYPHFTAEILQEIHTAIRSQRIQPLFKNARYNAGDIVYEDITVFPLGIKETDGAVIRVDNVTQRIRHEEAMIQTDKLMSVGVLAGGIAHDFNNILVGILGNLSMLSMYLSEDHVAHEMVRRAESASLRAKGLTRQLLTFSKGGSPILQATALPELINESAQFMLSGSSVSHRIDYAEDLLLVNVDVDQIGQVVQNLIINARDAMGDRGVISIYCSNVSQGDTVLPPVLTGEKYVCLEVRDTGPGIPESILPHIFDPYFTTKKEGSGLGLAVCHSIITKHEGFITVANEDGNGAVFTVFLPAEKQQEKTTTVHPAQEKTSVGNGKILVMDDEEYVCELLVGMLKYLGYSADTANNGVEAIQKYEDAADRGQAYDLVILDLTVPTGMGGEEVAKRLTTAYPDARMIVSSGYAHNQVMADHEEFGFKAALIKPFRLKDVANVVKSVIG